MPVTELELFQEHERSNWVRLRTLVRLRWVAIIGQIVAVVVAVGVFDIRMQVGLVAMTIGASVLANLFSTFLNPQNLRLSERQAVLMLVFDVLQMGVLLFLTGGLNNPFALLILSPPTIAATVLQRRSTVALVILTIVIISVIARFNLPIAMPNGAVVVTPDLFRFGFWIGLVVGVVFLATYARQVVDEMHTMREALVATQLALTREQKLTDLGGVVAAAAHELGTPLATIMLVSSELADELADRPALRDDAALIRQQAERCRDILRAMGRAGNEDMHMRHAPLETVVREAAEPHLARGKAVHLSVWPEELGFAPGTDPRQPVILRRPEIIHGLRNLIQNAVDFAASQVEVDVTWTDAVVRVRIVDDGPGFAQSLMPRIGDPLLRRRRRAVTTQPRRPGYEGMGLGLFIAKTLLERSGARLSFANVADDIGDRDAGGPAGTDDRPATGAIVVVEWPRAQVEPAVTALAAGLGRNRPIPV